MSNTTLENFEYEKRMKMREWVPKIPYLKFESTWKVKIVPPFGGALVRFSVSYNDRIVSVYLDCYDNLGFEGQPYWEAYLLESNNEETQLERFLMPDTKGLKGFIKRTLEND